MTSFMRNLKEPVTWNLILDRKLSEKRMFPAVDIPKSGTRREDLLTYHRQSRKQSIRCGRALNGMRAEDAVDNILNMFSRTKDNGEFIQLMKKTKISLDKLCYFVIQ